jgi:hypothetical protein
MRPCGFLDASRLHFFSFTLQAPPGGSFVAGFASRATYRARWLVLATWADVVGIRRRSWGSLSLRSLDLVRR